MEENEYKMKRWIRNNKNREEGKKENKKIRKNTKIELWG